MVQARFLKPFDPPPPPSEVEEELVWAGLAESPSSYSCGGWREGRRERGREGGMRYEGGMDETWRGVGAFAQAQGKGC